MLNKEIKLNKFLIIFLLLVCVITLGLYASYAYYEVSVIKNGVIVIKTATMDITTEVVDQENNTFTIPADSNITVTVNLTTDLTGEIGYKMYYEVMSGISTFNVTSTSTFTNDIVEANMTSSTQLQFTFTNLGSNDLTIKLGTKGGIANYPIPLDTGIELKLNTTLGVPAKDAIIESVNNPSGSCKTKVEEDGITYISGTKDCINFNYVWYSGKLWRITAIYPDGTMKMITDDEVTSISYGSDVNFYTDSENSSYIYQWLNEDFLDTLYNYENIIVTDSKWNSLTTSSISTKITEGVEGVTTTTSPVGLLNSYEYYMSYKNTNSSNGYLKNGYLWWLLNPYKTPDVWYVTNVDGHGGSRSPANAGGGGRPSINLKSGIQLSGGLGTKTDPYTIAGDKEEVTAGTTLLNARSSGEYVKFNNELYRIVSIENNITKINKNDYVRDTSNNVLMKKFSTSVTYGGGTSNDYWDYYFNNTWYNALDSASQNMIVESAYYIGSSGYNYKAAICATASNTVTTKDCEKTTSTWTGLVGLPRYGEMFASQQGSGYSSSSDMWLMNSAGIPDVWYVGGNDSVNHKRLSYTSGGRPSINLKSSIKITGGNGTKDNPFEISE